jgi:hypothetical protein
VAIHIRAEMNLLVTVYVDALQLAGPSGNLSLGWNLLKKRLDIGEASGLGVHLGCDPKEKTFIIDGKIKARGVVCDMEAFLEQSAARYPEVAGGIATKTSHTPFVNCDGPKGKTRDPARSRETSCQWRGRVGVDDAELEIPKEELHPIGEEPGELAGQAASALMKRLSP